MHRFDFELFWILCGKTGEFLFCFVWIDSSFYFRAELTNDWRFQSIFMWLMITRQKWINSNRKIYSNFAIKLFKIYRSSCMSMRWVSIPLSVCVCHIYEKLKKKKRKKHHTANLQMHYNETVDCRSNECESKCKLKFACMPFTEIIRERWIFFLQFLAKLEWISFFFFFLCVREYI